MKINNVHKAKSAIKRSLIKSKIKKNHIISSSLKKKSQCNWKMTKKRTKNRVKTLMSSMTWNHSKWMLQWWATILSLRNRKFRYKLKHNSKRTKFRKNKLRGKAKSMMQTWRSSTTWVQRRWMSRWWATSLNPLKQTQFDHLSTWIQTRTSSTLTKIANTQKAHKCTNTNSRVTMLNLILNPVSQKLTHKKLSGTNKYKKKAKNSSQDKILISSTICDLRKWMSRWWAMTQNLLNIRTMSIVRYKNSTRILSRQMRRLSSLKDSISMLKIWLTKIRCIQNLFSKFL